MQLYFNATPLLARISEICTVLCKNGRRAIPLFLPESKSALTEKRLPSDEHSSVACACNYPVMHPSQQIQQLLVVVALDQGGQGLREVFAVGFRFANQIQKEIVICGDRGVPDVFDKFCR